jgi:hypothetical protein
MVGVGNVIVEPDPKENDGGLVEEPGGFMFKKPVPEDSVDAAAAPAPNADPNPVAVVVEVPAMPPKPAKLDD